MKSHKTQALGNALSGRTGKVSLASDRHTITNKAIDIFSQYKFTDHFRSSYSFTRFQYDRLRQHTPVMKRKRKKDL